MRWRFRFEIPRAPHGLSANDSGVHRAVKAKRIAEVRDYVTERVEALCIPKCQSVSVQLDWHVTTRAVRDEDNLAPFTKPIYDAIGSNKGVGARITPDDSREYMTKLTPRIIYDKSQPAHFVVTIRDTTRKEKAVRVGPRRYRLPAR